MSSVTVAFIGWNSVTRAWNTSTWNTSPTFDVTATGGVGSATITGDANVSVTGVAGTSALGNLFTTNMGVTSTGAVGSATITGNANVSVTGVAGTTTLGSFFTTNTMVTMTASVNSASTAVTGNANVTVTGVSATGEIGILQQPWGLIIPSQTPNFSGITPTQSPSWADVAAQDKKMASVYTNDLRLEEIGSGEQSGSWGDTTNTNLELIAEAFSFGTEAITTNADTHTTTIADGATDPGRSLFLKYTGTLDSACTITLAPNTISKLWFIENGTSGSQNIIIKQGSGATITIPSGDTKAIYSDGAASSGKMVDAFASLSVVDLKVQDDLTVTDDASVGGDLLVSGEVQTANIGFTDGDNAMVIADGGAVTFPIASVFTGGFQSNGAINVGVDDTGYDVKFFGATASAYMLWDASADDLILGGAAGLSVNSAALVTGVLTTTAATVFNGGFAANTGCSINRTDNGVQLTLKSTDADASIGPILDLTRDSSSPADGDVLGLIRFKGDDAGGNETTYAQIAALIQDEAAGAEDGTLKIETLIAGSAQSRLDFTLSETVFNEGSIDLDFRVESNINTHALFVDGATDNVLIGTSDAGYPAFADNLTVADAANSGITIRSGTSGQGNIYFSDATGTGGGTFVGYVSYTHANDQMAFQAGGTVALTLGTAGGSTFGGGVTLNGELITTTLGADNFRAGDNALDSVESGGDKNIAIGYNALTALTTGDENIAIGYNTLVSAQTSINNVAIGDGALGNCTANSNIGVGVYAAHSVASNTGVICMGHYAGIYATGGGNICIGYLAGYSQNGSNKLTTGSGNILLGDQGSVAASDNVGSLVIGSGTGKGSNTGMLFASSGVYQSNNASAWSQTSDRRLKKNIVNSTIGLAEINQLQVRNFEYRTEDEITELDGAVDKIDVQGVQVGVIAQEIQAILPKCVSETSQGVLSVSSDNLTWHLIKAVQELSAKNDALEARLATLEGA